MFEGYLSHLLTTQFGHLVDNLDRKQVRISAWKGEIVLENLYLKNDALDQFAPPVEHNGTPRAPVEIVYGRIGRLEMRIPWKLLRSKQKAMDASLLLSDVVILVAPRKKRRHRRQDTERDETTASAERDNYPTNEGEDEVQASNDRGENSSSGEGSTDTTNQEYRRISKEQEVQAKLEARLFEQSMAENGKMRPGRKRYAWIQRWINSFFSNLSITVQNIHIRYEDTGHSMGFIWNESTRGMKGFSIGITLRQFSVQTMVNQDKKDDESNQTSDQEPSYVLRNKLAAVYQLSVYWDRGCPLVTQHVREAHPSPIRETEQHYFSAVFGLLNDQSEELNFVHRHLYHKPRHNYLLHPISPSVSFSLISVNSLEAGDVPPSSMRVTLPRCGLVIGRNLLEDASYLRKSLVLWKHTLETKLSEISVAHLLRIRPRESAVVDPRRWWKYAFEATLIVLRTQKTADFRERCQRKRRGWLGLTQGLALRSRYLKLYRRFLLESTHQAAAHNELIEMEEDLDVDEVVAFRSFVFSQVGYVDQIYDNREVSALPETHILSVDHRLKTYQDFASRLSETKSAFLIQCSEALDDPADATRGDDPFVWTTCVDCPEVSLQFDEQVRGSSKQKEFTGRPIIRLSFAFLQRNGLRVDGSWEAESSIASIQITDMLAGSKPMFQTLLGLKTVDTTLRKTVKINDIESRLAVNISVKRKLIGETGSCTTTFVRIMPLEALYSTAPIVALKRLFAAVKTPELTDDYHRIASVMSRWQDQQRKRLLLALAHRQKEIIIDIEVGAPVILIPENVTEESSQMLIVDLGRLTIHNKEKGSSGPTADRWKLLLSDIQVLNTTSLKHHSLSSGGKKGLIEPFSLDFDIETGIDRIEYNEERDRTQVKIRATLPRLVFNLSTSSVRLLRRLSRQWIRATTETISRRKESDWNEASLNESPKDINPRTTENSNKPSRSVEFTFSAPLIGIKVENDIEGKRDEQAEDLPVELVHIALRGIRGTFSQNATGNESTAVLDAKLQSLEAVDLYQRAGDDFAFLISSSVSPSQYRSKGIAIDELFAATSTRTGDRELVSMAYRCDREEEHSDRFDVIFHELFVEWNPETIAALHSAIALPDEATAVHSLERDFDESRKSEVGKSEISVSDDEFFDAIDHQTQDDDSGLISEISSRSSSPLQEKEIFFDSTGLGVPSPVWTSASPRVVLQSRLINALSGGQTDYSNEANVESSVDIPSADVFVPLEISFRLSKLQVNFNKDSRCRRLVSAEMDHTQVRYTTRSIGGWKMHAKIGNLSISDPESKTGGSLYKDLVGLQHEISAASLLELSFIKNPRQREFKPSTPYLDLGDSRNAPENLQQGVSFDSDGSLSGCDFLVQLDFSPMRFVYLQQLWFEVIDYFFEGITGFEVWGNKRPALQTFPVSALSAGHDLPISSRRRKDIQGADGKGFAFTRFVINLEAPVVLVPIAYRSPHFLRFQFQALFVSNLYTSQIEAIVVPGASDGAAFRERVQWYNNCKIHIKRLEIRDWNGKELTRNCSVPALETNGLIRLRWPSGPGSELVVPKWNVAGAIDHVNLYLRSDDYALFQHIIFHNIGEVSRHLHEWEEYLSKSDSEKERTLRSTFVKFGYDKKDTTPATYDVRIEMPSLSMFLLNDHASHENVLAEGQAKNFSWSLRKVRDFIVHQEILGDITLKENSSDFGNHLSSLYLLVPAKRAIDVEGWTPQLRYKSTSRPGGDNVKLLEISCAHIHGEYISWMRVKSFFSGLKDPVVWTDEEARMSMQVGDRWYKIGSSSSSNGANKSMNQVSLGSGSYQFRLVLISPKVVLQTVDSVESNAGVVLEMKHLDFFHMNNGNDRITKSLFVDGLELYVSASNAMKGKCRQSLIEPWSIIGLLERGYEKQEGFCDGYLFRVYSEMLRARAAYSDMSVAIDVGLRILSEMRSSRDENSKSHASVEELNQLKEDFEMSKRSPTLLSDAKLMFSGLNIMLVDDSMRHFGSSQELVSVSLDSILVSREESESDVGSDEQQAVRRTSVEVAGLTLFDCLQPEGSIFSAIASTSHDKKSTKVMNERKLPWAEYSTVDDLVWGYRLSESLLAELGFVHPRTSQVLRFSSTTNEGKAHDVDLNVPLFRMQWNPSTVIALQRFLGRFWKEAKSKAELKLQRDIDELIHSESEAGLPKEPTNSLPLVFNLEVVELCIYLNKEHQNRRLVKSIQSDTKLSLHKDSKDALTMRGSIGGLTVWDEDSYSLKTISISDDNRPIFRVASDATKNGGPFFQFEYVTKVNIDVSPNSLPSWVCQRLRSSGESRKDIDDCLSLSVLSVEFVYLSERTAEILDYLSNGLPGKGMGATSRAAKGFIEKRIQTRSFLQVNVDSPRVRIPLSENISENVILRLGDSSLRSWFEHGTQEEMSRFEKEVISGAMSGFHSAGGRWWRMLSMNVRGLGWHTSRTDAGARLPVNLSVDLRKPTGTGHATLLSAKLSYIDLVLRYSEYVLLRAILRRNVLRKHDTDKWDNIEKAFWNEEELSGQADSAQSSFVVYSKGARFVRYGHKGRREKNAGRNTPMDSKREERSSPHLVIDFRFLLDGLCLKLNRDDDIYGMKGSSFADAFTYDMILLKVNSVEMSFQRNSIGDTSFHLSLFRLGLYDIGDVGRLARERYFQNLSLERDDDVKTVVSRNPSMFSVLAEGYSPDETRKERSHDDRDPQLIITVETCPASSTGNIWSSHSVDLGNEKVTLARIVVNYLTINALIRPVREALAFFVCEWAVADHDGSSYAGMASNDASDPDVAKGTRETVDSRKLNATQIKIVAHYPRVFFLADESDPHSKALVLRGLAVVNIINFQEQKFLTQNMMVDDDGDILLLSSDQDNHRALSFEGHLHSMESYVNSDAQSILGLSHADRVLSEGHSDRLRKTDTLGVALIEPVTAAIEFNQTKRDRFPLARNCSVMVEPVSTMLSFEDLSLIRSVARRLSRSRSQPNPVTSAPSNNDHESPALGVTADERTSPPTSRGSFAKVEFEVQFDEPRLGLVLKKTAVGIIVEATPGVVGHNVLAGDELIAINAEEIGSHSLNRVVKSLGRHPRPITLRFCRCHETCENTVKTPTVAVSQESEHPKSGDSAFEVSLTPQIFSSLEFSKGLFNLPVVSSTDPDAALYQQGGVIGGCMYRFPLTGAVLVSIDGRDCLGRNHEDIFRDLEAYLETADENGFCTPDHTMTFMEIDSDSWGGVDTFDVAASEIRLTVIDDFKGRDMPLIRARLDGVEMRLNMGTGVKTPTIQSLESISFEAQLLRKPRRQLFGESARYMMNAQIDVDYYHAHIAMWEPLLEPSQFHIVVEKRREADLTGAFPRQVSISMLDHIPMESFENNRAQRFRSPDSIISLNVTDAAATVVARSISEFQEWRQTKDSGLTDDHYVTMKSLAQVGLSGDSDPKLTQSRAERETQRAAQAALAFAQNRVSSSQNHGESSKPFTLRNRTGLSFWFCEEESSVAGGLRNSRPLASGTLETDGECRFNLEMLSNRVDTQTSGVWGAVRDRNKIRAYDGQFPRISLSFESSNGIVIEPLRDLPVSKVGIFLRYLVVLRRTDDGARQLQIPVLWRVELEDNRRILTISSSVMVSSRSFEYEMEIGYIKDATVVGKEPSKDELSVVSLGIAKFGSPLFLPLWLTTGFKSTNIHARPVSDGSSVFWSKEAFLVFRPDSLHRDHTVSRWSWRPVFRSSRLLLCETAEAERCSWLSCQLEPQNASEWNLPVENNGDGKLSGDSDLNEVISISVDTCLGLRNLLPTSIQWEVAMKQKTVSWVSFTESSLSSELLQSGERVELLHYNVIGAHIIVRFRPNEDFSWTDWTSVNVAHALQLPGTNDGDDPDKRNARALNSRQTNLQCVDGLGTPLTLGIRFVPRVSSLAAGDDDCYGLDLILHAELWVRNLTSLPLNFGCPPDQIDLPNQPKRQEPYELSGKLVAEAALLELASVLELGDGAKGLRSDEDKHLDDIEKVHLLPFQFGVLFIEVFEFVETEEGLAKRRWWASQNHSSPRKDPRSMKASQDQEWINAWEIDCAGFATASAGGWESCRNLIGTSDVTFNEKRTFNESNKFRRRRWVRKLRTRPGTKSTLNGGINAFHQPVVDSFSRAQLSWERKRGRSKEEIDEDQTNVDDRSLSLRLSVRCGDGQWGQFATPTSGGAHGVLRVLGSRWPPITRTSWATAKELKRVQTFEPPLVDKNTPHLRFATGSLSPEAFDLCYHVRELKGEWGEFTRVLDVAPRFLFRNDSSQLSFQLKQTGTPDECAVIVGPGNYLEFYWSDERLPELVSVRPVSIADDYKWSGGFDISTLGMFPLRVRLGSVNQASSTGGPMFSIRALVEIRPGAGASGINVSLKEEDPRGDGALYRIENMSPFPIWIAQDGVLANPSRSAVTQEKGSGVNASIGTSWASHADFVQPFDQAVFALDVPFRQGKYAGRKAVSMEDLLRVRVSLAPLGSRDGIESTKVIGLTKVGQAVRLNPTKLNSLKSAKVDRLLGSIRIIAVVTTDGPTRVLKVMLVEKESSSYSASPGSSAYGGQPQLSQHGEKSSGWDPFRKMIFDGAVKALEKKKAGEILFESEARRQAFFGDGNTGSSPDTKTSANDTIFAFQANVRGFLVSLVDSAPSEIAVISLRDVIAAAKWDSRGVADASAFVSVAWLQVDNHVPGSPFPVAACPDNHETETDDSQATPLLLVGMNFAPRHKSGILCLRNVTVAPRNLAIAIDLAFIVRLQRFFVGILSKFTDIPSETGQILQFPDIEGIDFQKSSFSSSSSQKYYFEGLTVLPSNINLSVAPARALTPSQAALEGPETAAIHAAVRKGDLLLASGIVGVHIGGKNKTAAAVVRGVLKSILVDALLRCNGASLNLEGIALRNHISTRPQLLTYLSAHYVASIKSNLPAVLGSLAALGNPLGLIRGLGDGMSDFVNEPVKGLKRSVQELDPVHAIDGVARGTESLARHTVGGIADSASLLTETLSQNLAVLTLDRRYAQKRDRVRFDQRDDFTFVEGVESGMLQLVRGVFDGVTGVVKAPIRGAEKNGFEGFAKGVGKGLLGLLVKPMIGLSDAATDVMIGVRGSVEGGQVQRRGVHGIRQIRPRRPFYGNYKVMKRYSGADAAASTLMLRSRLAGENYLSHLDMGDRVALLSIGKMVLIGADGREQLQVKFKHIKSVEVREMNQADGSDGWGIIVLLLVPRKNGSTLEVINCGPANGTAEELARQMGRGMSLVGEDS